MFELLSKLSINFSSKDQVLQVLDKCNTLLIGGELGLVLELYWKLIYNFHIQFIVKNVTYMY